MICRMLFRSLVLFVALTPDCGRGDEELLIIHEGDLPIVISAPHGGAIELPDVPIRKGEGLKKGGAGFFSGRDGGTEELALEVVKRLDEKLPGAPSCVISRVHRKYVDFNRPPEIGVEHDKARTIHDSYHQSLQSTVRRIRERFGSGLLVDIHGQGSSATTVFRGTSNGLTVQGLRMKLGEESHTGEHSLLGLLKTTGWKVHPDPFSDKEQSGFTGGHIVRTYGSHRPDGIDAVQLEFGADYRKAAAREKVAGQLADAIVQYAERYLNVAPATSAR
jgi:N-formylglutamate amidohydrolase